MDNLELYTDYEKLPVIPLRALVVFPNMTLHFDVGRKKSIAALKHAMEHHRNILLVTQRDASVDRPTQHDLYETGVICTVKQLIRLPNSNNLRVAVEGITRAVLVEITDESPFYTGIAGVNEAKSDLPTAESKAYIKAVKSEFKHYAAHFSKISNEVVMNILTINDCGELADYICANSFFDYKQKQMVLDEFSPLERIQLVLHLLKNENESLSIQAEIQAKVQKEIDKNQREYYLREEMKVISDELGEGENPMEEADEYRTKVNALSCSDEIKEKLLKECDKLAKMPFGSHEGTVVRTYLDKCLEIPFGVYSKDSVDIVKARKVLDRDHYGLEKVKDRITESLAVLKRNPDFNGQIICLYGPPGVGKTSIVRSLAESMNRQYVRIALGGIHDEAEIRGHRRTYIGAMLGRIMDAVIKSGTMNPIVLLDEIDKVGNDYKGDPSSALLEALDPEQNSSFTDHYIDFPVDLSRVLFITTANDTSTISAPLYDRMEVIELNSYTVEEKFKIAKKHLVKKEMRKHSLSAKEFRVTDGAIYRIIEAYTREAGVRNLEKMLAKLCRKATVALESGAVSVRVTEKNLADYLGKEKYTKDSVDKENRIGVVNGLAWTSVGGTMLPIEISALDGTGKIELTGNLGDVMKESAKTAVSYIRSKSELFGVEHDFYKTKDIHIHAPEAAIPKDGPSAGLAITTALLSELTQIPIRYNVAMTGEISLKGRALPIGGLKEKSMAAYKAGCDTVIIPQENAKDLSEISDEVKNSVRFVTVSSFEDLIPYALCDTPEAQRKTYTPHVAKYEQSSQGTVI